MPQPRALASSLTVCCLWPGADSRPALAI